MQQPTAATPCPATRVRLLPPRKECHGCPKASRFSIVSSGSALASSTSGRPHPSNPHRPAAAACRALPSGVVVFELALEHERDEAATSSQCARAEGHEHLTSSRIPAAPPASQARITMTELEAPARCRPWNRRHWEWIRDARNLRIRLELAPCPIHVAPLSKPRCSPAMDSSSGSWEDGILALPLLRLLTVSPASPGPTCNRPNRVRLVGRCIEPGIRPAR